MNEPECAAQRHALQAHSCVQKVCTLWIYNSVLASQGMYASVQAMASPESELGADVAVPALPLSGLGSQTALSNFSLTPPCATDDWFIAIQKVCAYI